MELEYNNIKYNFNPLYKNIHVYNSHFVTCDKTKIDFINHFIKEHFLFLSKRKMKSFLREWKAHNICYQHGWWKERTAEVDFEAKQNIFYKIGYWFICLFFKEKHE